MRRILAESGLQLSSPRVSDQVSVNHACSWARERQGVGGVDGWMDRECESD